MSSPLNESTENQQRLADQVIAHVKSLNEILCTAAAAKLTVNLEVAPVANLIENRQELRCEVLRIEELGSNMNEAGS